MDFIDLHTHSSYSDGTMTPIELIQYAKQKKLRAIALTDHDCIDGIEEALTAAEEIELVTGVELAANYNSFEIHILGYFIDFRNENLRAKLNWLKQMRYERNLVIIQKLNAMGINICYDDINAVVAEDKGIVSRMHIAIGIAKKGYAKNSQEALKKYLSIGRPAYVARTSLTPKQCIELIEQAGGKAYLAHPLMYKLDLDEVESLIRTLKQYGLSGIEAIYSMNSEGDEANMIRLANKYGLKYSGGSDFHGNNKPYIDMGKGRGNLKVPYFILENMLK